jgi:hypothetical protein
MTLIIQKPTGAKLNLAQTSVAPLLLDSYSGAAAAYSLRSLSLAYGGSVVRVRRSSDNTEADFTAKQVSDGSLATWVGAGNNGFVRVWYDQSGNGANLTQTTTTAQPTIVSSGILVDDAGKPAILTDGTSDFMQSANGAIGVASALYVCAVGSITAADNRPIIAASNGGYTSANEWIVVRRSNGFINFRRQLPSSSMDINLPDTATRNLFQFLVTPSVSSAWVNAATASSATATSTLNLSAEIDFRSLDNSGSILATSPGKTQEIIVYRSDQSASRAAIESDINTHYAIY